MLAVPELLLDLHPLAGNPPATPAKSFRECDRFKRELTASQFFQRSRYPGNPGKTAALKQNIQILFQRSISAGAGLHFQRQVPFHLGPQPDIKNEQKSNTKSTAPTLLKIKSQLTRKWMSKGSHYGLRIHKQIAFFFFRSHLGRPSGENMKM